MERVEAETCATCGFHESITDTDTHDFAIETPRCPVCAAKERFERIQLDVDEKKRGSEPPANRHDPADGRRIVIRYKGKATTPPE